MYVCIYTLYMYNCIYIIFGNFYTCGFHWLFRDKTEGDEEKKKKKEKDEQQKKRKIKAAFKPDDDSDMDRADGEWEVVKNGVAVPAVNICGNFLLHKRSAWLIFHWLHS